MLKELYHGEISPSERKANVINLKQLLNGKENVWNA